MIRGNHADGLPYSSKSEQKRGFSGMGKQARAPFPISIDYRALRPLKLVYTDLCGPNTPSTLGGRSYFLLILMVFIG